MGRDGILQKSVDCIWSRYCCVKVISPFMRQEAQCQRRCNKVTAVERTWCPTATDLRAQTGVYKGPGPGVMGQKLLQLLQYYLHLLLKKCNCSHLKIWHLLKAIRTLLKTLVVSGHKFEHLKKKVLYRVPDTRCQIDIFFVYTVKCKFLDLHMIKRMIDEND